MAKRIAAILAAAALGSGCARSVSLSRSDAGRLEASEEIPLVYRTSPSPWVDCPRDEAEDVWRSTFSSAGRPGGSIPAGMRGRGTAYPVSQVSWNAVPTSSSIWQDYQNQRTASLRASPPVDPARATGVRFSELARSAPRLVRLQEAAASVETDDPAALARQLGPVPALVFETTRWVLVGCWYAYHPWFDVRATLLDLGSGKVLWRATCGGLYPPDRSREASPAELEANGKALYTRMIEERAGQCATELLAGLERDLAASRGNAAPITTPSRPARAASPSAP